MRRVPVSISVRLLRVIVLRVIPILLLRVRLPPLLLLLLLLLAWIVSLSWPVLTPPRNRRRPHLAVEVRLLWPYILRMIIIMSRPHTSNKLLLPRRRRLPVTAWPSWRTFERITGLISRIMLVVSVIALYGTPAPGRRGTTRAALPGFDMFRLMVGSIFNNFMLASSPDSTLWSATTSNLEHKLLKQNTRISTQIY